MLCVWSIGRPSKTLFSYSRHPNQWKFSLTVLHEQPPGGDEKALKTDRKGHLALCLLIKNANSICVNCEIFGYPGRLKGLSLWDGCQGIIKAHKHFIWWVPCLTLKHKAGTPGPGDLLMFLLQGGICTGASEGSGWSMRQCTFLVCIYIEVAGLPRSWEKAERR